MHAVEAVRLPAPLDLTQRPAHQEAPLRRDHAHVVAVRLQVEHVLAAHEPRPAARHVDRERLHRVRRSPLHPRQRLRDPRPRHRLHQIVQRPQLEGLDRRRLVRRDEDQRGRAGEAPQHARELDPVQPGHAHVEEDRVVVLPTRERVQRLLARLGRRHLAHRRLRAQHPREIVERGALVVDGEDAERHAPRIRCVSPSGARSRGKRGPGRRASSVRRRSSAPPRRSGRDRRSRRGPRTRRRSTHLARRRGP